MSFARYTYERGNRVGVVVRCQCCGQCDTVPLWRAGTGELCVPCQGWSGEIFAAHFPSTFTDTDVFGLAPIRRTHHASG